MPVFSGIISVKVVRARNLANHDSFLSGKSDPYVIVFLDQTKVGQTRVINDDLNPEWREVFEYDSNEHFDKLRIELWNSNIIKDDYLGGSDLHLQSFQSQKKFKTKAWYQLQPHKDWKLPVTGSVKVGLEFKGRSVTDSFRLVNSVFPVRTECRVSLYQDAHVGEGVVPKGFEQVAEWLQVNNLYEDVYKAIFAAKKFVYITGWSVSTAISLIRRRPIKGEKLTIGELLKKKADEGVRVLIHIWDEKLSTSIGGVSLNGVMGTFDEETRNFFAGSKVTVKLSFREGSIQGEYIWTHHQKTVILDAPSRRGKTSTERRIIAFVGGLDLTNGRWDTPAHVLYGSIATDHLTDFHMPWSVCSACGPREPWHDIHTRVEGDIALDVLTNFEERWKKQAAPLTDLLYDFEKNASSFAKKEQFDEDDPELWNVQLFRSIDSHSATIKGVERGIQDAYINAIRVAKNFIYIENQYFMSSSPHWLAETTSGCNNTIAHELTSRIIDAIGQKQQFNVYIVLPMFPEGVPAEAAIQEMLKWQWLTIESMYHRIAHAIKQAKLNAHPTDYLNFYCLGNRDVNVNTSSYTPKNLFETLLVQSNRFMIYVHSKLLIADDQYIICGSSNINERSMAGDRDTEICIGAWQPNVIREHEHEKLPHQDDPDEEKVTFGDYDDPELKYSIYGSKSSFHPKYGQQSAVRRFRLSLWVEHTATFHPDYLIPNTLDTVHRINKIAEENWENFAAPSSKPMQSHLMKYPYTIAQDGKIEAKCEHFPDTTAAIRGVSSFTMVNLLTQ
jgi:phospholipase D1/2